VEPIDKELLANLPGRTKSLDDLVKEFDTFAENDRRLQSRWIIGLVVANGGAMTALAGKTLDLLGTSGTDESRAAVALSIPSLWFFAAGLALAGVAGLLELLRNQKAMQSVHRSIRIRQNIHGSVTQDELDPPALFSWSVEIASGAAFLGGLVYPLIVLALRYCGAGVVEW
jgi:hypothetical protein